MYPTNSQELQESAIRPTKQYKKWLEILEEELPFHFSGKLVSVPCVGCGALNAKQIFSKFCFSYKKCNKCQSMFVSPRPTSESLDRFYRHSKALKFWQKTIFSQTKDIRRTHHIYPLQEWCKSIVKDRNKKFVHALDFEQKFLSLWDRQFITHLPTLKRISVTGLAFDIETTPHAKKISVGQIKSGTVDIISALDVLDRVFDPAATIKTLASLCSRGGVLLLTLNTGSGFEYLVLGEHSPRLVPPDRLNLLTIEAVTALLKKNGFRLLDISTPGKLDVQIVHETFKEDPHFSLDPFLEYVFKSRSAIALESLQDFLQLNTLSSYLRIAAVKK